MKNRAFIAINLPLEIKAKFEELISQLKARNSSPFLSFVRPEGVHLTLHFLGEIGPETTKAIKISLAEMVKNFSGFTFTPVTISAFPDLRRPRVIFLSLKTDQLTELMTLQKRLGQKLKAIGIVTDERPWQPHLTLALVKGPVNLNAEGIEIPSETFITKSVELMSSELKPTSVKYSVLASYHLK